ncbi:MAG: AbrB family transcriptional regulator [Pseudomonadota bacterium]
MSGDAPRDPSRRALWAARLSRPALTRLGLGLAVGAAGGAAAEAAGVPLAWMLGAMALCMILRLAGAPLEVPMWFRTLFMGLIGLFLGESFGQADAAQLARWPLTLALAVIYVPVAGALCFWLFVGLRAFPRATALLCALPGGLTAVAMFAEQAGGDERRVALFHALRVAFVVLIAPVIAFVWLGLPKPTDEIFAEGGVLTAGDAALLGAVSLACAWGVARAGWPLPYLMGPLIASALLRFPGLIEGGLPGWLVEVALLVSGASIGSRFHGVGWRFFGAVAMWTALGTLLLMAVSLVFAWAVSAGLGVNLFAALLAYAPGGVAEMSLIALAIDADPAFVATHHMARIFAILFALPFIAGFLQRLLAEDPDGRGPPPASRPPT